ncbi:MAG: MATE family efflux transporter [Clostridiales bacterium]|nr:MATE family efflux transporter [Clostridiales bacterium]
MVKDLTKGKPAKLILNFCLPLMLGQVFQQFYNMVDSIIVGRFAGTLQLSAVGSTGSISFLVIGFVTGLVTGFSIPLSQAFGEENEEKLKKTFANSVYHTGVAAVVLTLATYFGTPVILKLMHTPPEIYDMAYDYIGTVFLGLGATLFYNLFAAVMRSLGDSRTPLLLLIFSSLLNIVLDLIMVRIFHLDCLGVAIATVIAQTVSAVLALIIIIKKFKIVHFNSQQGRPDAQVSKKLVVTGLPMALQMSVTAIGSIMLQTAVNGLGPDVIAAVTIGSKIQLMLMLLAETFGATMATYCGQNLGAGRMDRIKEGMYSSIGMSMLYTLLAVAFAFFFGKELGSLFIKENPDAVLELVSQFLRTCCFFYPVLSLLFIFRAAIQGMGHSFPAMFAGVLELFARGIMSYLVIPRFGYDAVVFANQTAWCSAMLLLVPVFFISYAREKKRINPNS